MLEIIGFCKHRAAHWEGILFRAPNGKEYVTNGIYEWPLNEKRRADLMLADKVDTDKILMRLNEREGSFTGPPKELVEAVKAIPACMPMNERL